MRCGPHLVLVVVVTFVLQGSCDSGRNDQGPIERGVYTESRPVEAKRDPAPGTSAAANPIGSGMLEPHPSLRGAPDAVARRVASSDGQIVAMLEAPNAKAEALLEKLRAEPSARPSTAQSGLTVGSAAAPLSTMQTP